MTLTRRVRLSLIVVLLLAAAALFGAQQAAAAITTHQARCGKGPTAPPNAQLTAPACVGAWSGIGSAVHVRWVVNTNPAGQPIEVDPDIPLAQRCTPNAVQSFATEGLHTLLCRVRDLSPNPDPLGQPIPSDWNPLNPPPLSVTVGVDLTPPAATIVASRPPDVNGWYTSPVVLTTTGTDTPSGIAGCTPPQVYAGPDTGSAVLSGTCTDVAGNVSVPSVTSIRYDVTPPGLEGVTAKGTTNSILVDWQASSDTSVVEVARTHSLSAGAAAVIYRGFGSQVIDQGVGRLGLYTYRVTAFDQAGNTTSRVASASVQPGVTLPRTLLTPRDGARVLVPPTLRWPAVAKTRYYNVQLYHKGRKIYSGWPPRTSLRLPKTWKYKGKRYRMPVAAKLRWFVWPAFGTVARPRFGKLIGTSTFVVRKRR